MLYQLNIWARDYKSVFMLSSAEYEILDAYRYIGYQEIKHFSASDKLRMLFFLLIKVEMPTIVAFQHL